MDKVSFIGDFQASHGLPKGEGNGTPRRTVPTSAFHVFPPILRVVSSAVILKYRWFEKGSPQHRDLSRFFQYHDDGEEERQQTCVTNFTFGLNHANSVSSNASVQQISLLKTSPLTAQNLRLCCPWYNHLEPGKRIAMQQKIVPVGLLTGNIYRGPQKDRRVSRML